MIESIKNGVGWPRAEGEDLERITIFEGETKIGSIVVGVGPRLRGHVMYVRVDPAFRGRGYGLRLYLAAIRRCGKIVTTGHSDDAARVWDALTRVGCVHVAHMADRWTAALAAPQ